MPGCHRCALHSTIYFCTIAGNALSTGATFRLDNQDWGYNVSLFVLTLATYQCLDFAIRI